MVVYFPIFPFPHFLMPLKQGTSAMYAKFVLRTQPRVWRANIAAEFSAITIQSMYQPRRQSASVLSFLLLTSIVCLDRINPELHLGTCCVHCALHGTGCSPSGVLVSNRAYGPLEYASDIAQDKELIYHMLGVDVLFTVRIARLCRRIRYGRHR